MCEKNTLSLEQRHNILNYKFELKRLVYQAMHWRQVRTLSDSNLL